MSLIEGNDAQFHALMEKITFEHGGPEYDSKYPDGIPTSIIMTTGDGRRYDSGLVMYPAGHARNTTAKLADILDTKFQMLGALAAENPAELIHRFNSLPQMTSAELASVYEFEILQRGRFE